MGGRSVFGYSSSVCRVSKETRDRFFDIIEARQRGWGFTEITRRSSKACDYSKSCLFRRIIWSVANSRPCSNTQVKCASPMN